MARWRRAVLGGGVMAAVFGGGFLTGLVSERLQYDVKRTAVVQRYERLAAERRAQLMERERAAPPVTSPRRP